jgi:hypothetical protein
MHIDEFIDDYSTDPYATWVLNHFRLPAILKSKFDEFMKGHKLFCVYEGKKYRCIGASRLGDVWLTSKFDRESGYEHRVDVEMCSEWSKD